MDASIRKDNPNPRERANPLSVLFYIYTLGIFKTGYRKTLGAEDLYDPLKGDKSGYLGDRLEKRWNDHLKSVKESHKQPSLLKVLLRTFWVEIFFIGFTQFIQYCVIKMLQPLLLGQLLEYFSPESGMEKSEAYYYAGGLVGMNLCSVILVNKYLYSSSCYGMQARAACCSLIYRKALRFSRTSLGDTASGRVVNLLSNDVSRFEHVLLMVNHLWLGPFSTTVILYILWTKAGLAGLIGIIPVFLVVPLQSYIGKLSAKFRRQTAYKTDERVRLMDEIIAGIQVIKMYAWEKPFQKLVQIARMKELQVIIKSSYVRGLFMTFHLCTTRIALFCALLTMVLDGQEITATTVFVFMAYFNVISQGMSSMFVRAITEVAEVLVSIKRLQEFLLYEEFKAIDCSHHISDNVVLKMANVTAKWDANKTTHALTNINLDVKKGQLIGVIGPVGSGKSSLLQTILGELEISLGTISTNAAISYSSQEAWVFASTLRQNIIFGRTFNNKRYNEVITSCALKEDFNQLSNSDQTYVGERGVSLSGGQKARVNLARAIYQEADIYLLDDPLSAVDTHVGNHLFNKCINGYLKTKTRILVTHQVHHLQQADHIIVMGDGLIVAEGSYESLAKNGHLDCTKLDELKEVPRGSELSLVETESKLEPETPHPIHEDSSKGKVEGSLFWKYLRYGNNCFFVVFVLSLYILAQVTASGVDYFVTFWTNIEETRSTLNTTNSNRTLIYTETIVDMFTTETCLYFYGGLVAVMLLVTATRSILFSKLAMRSSAKIHESMLEKLIYTSMRFYDVNPSGRVLNRFAKDIGSVDDALPRMLLDTGQTLLLMSGRAILIAVVNPYFVIPIVVLCSMFYLMRLIYLKSSKNIKRLEGIVKSPVFTHINATIQGLTTIRAFGAEEMLIAEFNNHQDVHTSCCYMYIAANMAFGFYLDFLCFFFISAVTLSLLTFGEVLGLQGADVGLAISQATALSGMIQFGMRQSAEVANQLMSVERVLEYTLLPGEKQPLKPNTPNKFWPESGKIEIKRMTVRYATTLPPVIENIDAVIQPKEKVGIVGRTGAGKSSLIAALFRLTNVDGEIRIDDCDTSCLNLQHLRSKISIIPQDPVLFSGSLRYNLDPFEEYSDELLWKALEEVELKDSANIINQLDYAVMGRGANYSVGQRQLICLARAIIRNNKILMLDEATANVDQHTDMLIQKTIRSKFKDCTVLTIAHRLNTIMDSDKVIVMDAGKIIENNHPYLLLEDESGKFFKMVESTGSATAEQLKTIARDCYIKKNV